MSECVYIVWVGVDKGGEGQGEQSHNFVSIELKSGLNWIRTVYCWTLMVNLKWDHILG